MYTFSQGKRNEWLRETNEATYDVVVIGGGITGVGIALDAVTRGMDVFLLDMQDFAGGTSSRSTKLVHGGLRYLKQLEVKMVADVGHEREIVFRNALHVTRPERMLLPIYKGGTFGKYSTGLGLSVYDALARVKRSERRTMLSKEETLEKEPLLARDGLVGGGRYVEYRTDDARLTIEVAKRAVQEGARLVNYVKATGFTYDEDGRVNGVEAVDEWTGEAYTVNGRKVVNATGPWVETLVDEDAPIQEKQLFHSKGVHIVVDSRTFPLRQAVYFDTPDGRMVFAIPRGGKTYVGTTDTEYEGDLVHPEATDEDRAYLLEAIHGMFPDVHVTEAEIESSWAGVRPLIREEGKDPSEISRKDEIWESSTGLLTIAGGKLTGYRLMAEEIVDVLAKQLKKEGRRFKRCQTEHLRLSGGDFSSVAAYDEYVKTKAKDFVAAGLTYDEGEAIVSVYGTNAPTLLRMAYDYDPSSPLPQALETILRYSIDHESVITAVDFFVRRTGAMFFDKSWVIKWREPVLERMATLLKWSEDRVAIERRALEEEIDRTR